MATKANIALTANVPDADPQESCSGPPAHSHRLPAQFVTACPARARCAVLLGAGREVAAPGVHMAGSQAAIAALLARMAFPEFNDIVFAGEHFPEGICANARCGSERWLVPLGRSGGEAHPLRQGRLQPGRRPRRQWHNAAVCPGSCTRVASAGSRHQLSFRPSVAICAVRSPPCHYAPIPTSLLRVLSLPRCERRELGTRAARPRRVPRPCPRQLPLVPAHLQ